MVPDNEPLSAFAIYSGQNGTTRNSRKKKKMRSKKMAVKAVAALSQEDKKKILKQKKDKIESVLKKKDVDVSKEIDKTLKTGKPKKIKKNKVPSPPVQKKKKPKKKKTQKNVSSEGIEPSILSQVASFRMEKEGSSTKKSQIADQARTFALQQKNSIQVGQETLAKIIGPMTVDTFMRDYWEKAPVYIPTVNSKRFGKLISTPMMDEILRENIMLFGTDVDVTTYTDGVRETHNPEARAQAHIVWDYYSNGCSVRLLSPQTYSPNLLTLNSALQEYFGSFVGANVYLTPPNSQGFAPHFDDIEAFVLQIEGKKKWKIYSPRNKYETLPRFSSKNFTPDEITQPPVLDVTLKAGDVLYFPRGYIHQARTLHNEHSLHITISVYQKTAWCDLLEKALPKALQKAIGEDVEFRKGLPINYLKQAGFAHKNGPERHLLVQNLKKLVSKLVNYINIDHAVDQMGTQFMHDALPPVLSVEEASCSVIGNGLRMEENGRLRNRVEVTPETRVRLIRANCSRFVTEEVTFEDGLKETQFRLYLSVDNLKEYHQGEPQYLILPETMVPAMKYLISTYPLFTSINALPCETDDEKMLLATDLWDRGVLVTETPFDEVHGDDTLQSIDEISHIDVDEDDEEDDEQDENSMSDIKNILKEMTADEELNDYDKTSSSIKTPTKRNFIKLHMTNDIEESDDEAADDAPDDGPDLSDLSGDESNYFFCQDSSSESV